MGPFFTDLASQPSGVEDGEDQKPGGVEVGLDIQDKDAYRIHPDPGTS